MKAVVLVDNISSGEFCGEWGLSFYIEHEGRRYLLDAGKSSRFAKNAEKLGISLADVDCAVLSHAHYDHADGMGAFFRANKTAPLYLRRCAYEKCYDRKNPAVPRYIGIGKGILKRWKPRLRYVDGPTQLSDGVTILPHTAPELEAVGLRASMFIRRNHVWVPDAFAHEQSLVFRTEAGLVVFNSCSHAGPGVILREVAEAFPGEKIRALVGGLHLFIRTPEEIRAFADEIRASGIEKVITGHCTGDEAYRILREELGETVEQMYSGMTISF